MRLADRQQKLFNDNFDRQAFDKVKGIMEQAIAKAGNFEGLIYALRDFNHDVEFEDNFTIISCDVELDRSGMKTAASYVGVTIVIKWDDKANKGKIDIAELYSNELTGQYEADLLCVIDADTYEVIHWVYDGPMPDTDDKQ